MKILANLVRPAPLRRGMIRNIRVFRGKIVSMNEVDLYLAGVPSPQREQLERVRAIVKRLVPDATEGISYKIPTFKLNGMLISYAAFSNHCSVFPGKAPVVALAEELTQFRTSAGTVQFTPENPLPDELLARIVGLCVARNLAKRKGKRSGKPGPS